MKKTLASMAAIVIIMAAFSSCQKESDVVDTFTTTMEKVTDDQNNKTTMDRGFMHWMTGDKIKVFGSESSGIYTVNNAGSGQVLFVRESGNPGSAPYCAIYPASSAIDNNTIELPVIQVTADGSLTGYPMYAESHGTSLDFKNLCGILRLRLQKEGINVTAIEITTDIDIVGDFSVNYNNGNPILTSVSHGFNNVMMTCARAQSINSQKDFYLFLPAHTYEAMRIRIYSSDGGVCTKTVSNGYSVRVQRSKITTITLSDNNLTFTPNAGALSGLFTINELGDKVRFSQGNLQYTILGTHTGALGNNMPGTWRFAPNQYERVGYRYGESHQSIYDGLEYISVDISDNYRSWIDLFGWGTGNNPTLSSMYTEYNTFVDWGMNAISNGGNVGNLWRTLTYNDWSYILWGRDDASDKFATGNINGIGGFILIPDNWTTPAGCSFSPGGAGDWTHNSYTHLQWELMETSGAIFFPACGHREGTDVDAVFNYSWYHTSTPMGELGGYVYFIAGDCGGVSNGGCLPYNGLSVRLVKDVE